MVYHLSVLVLRTKHDDLRIRIDPDIMSRRPVEKVIRIHRFLNSLRVGGRQAASQNEAPVGTLAEIACSSLEQWCRVHPGGKSEVLSADLAKSARVPKFGLLSDNRTRDLHLYLNPIFCNMHRDPLLSV